MSLAAATRFNILFNEVFTIYEAMKIVGHPLCPCVKALVRYSECILATMAVVKRNPCHVRPMASVPMAHVFAIQVTAGMDIIFPIAIVNFTTQQL